MGHYFRISALFLLLIGMTVTGLPVVRPAAAGVGTDIVTDTAASGCSSVTASMLTTEVSVNSHHLTFTAAPGDKPLQAQTLVVKCLDPSDDFDSGCNGSVSVNQPWLKVDHTDFSGVDVIPVTVDPTDLPAGTHEGKIHVSSNMVSIDDEEDVQVELVIEDPSAKAPAHP